MTVVDVSEGVTAAALRARGGTKWTKHDEDVLAAWVADMDFPVAEPIRRTLIAAVERSALGYAPATQQEELFAACARWLERRYGWATNPIQYAILCDVVQGIHTALHTLTEPGDGVIVQGPIYPPFLTSIELQGRRVIDNRLTDPTGAAALDLDELRRQAADPRTTLLLLCNPHNPTGRVYTRAELEGIAQIAIDHDLTVLSDEIWMDIIYPGHRHIPFQALGPEIAARTVTMTSATKSFNLGGMRCAVAIFGSPALQERFDRLPSRIRGTANTLAVLATIAAWDECEGWFDAALGRLDANRLQVIEFMRTRLPEVKQRPPEGTFVTWLDFSAYQLELPAADYLLNRARVALNDGAAFGGDAGCARLNFATSPAILSEICERIAASLA